MGPCRVAVLQHGPMSIHPIYTEARATFRGHTPHMDPFSVAAGALSLVAACGKLSEHILKYVNACQTVDENVQVLRIEVDMLSRVLYALHSKLREPRLAHAAFDVQTGHERQHWESVKQLMDDCEGTLLSLERILDGVGRSNSLRGFLRKPVKKFKLDIRQSDIESHKHAIAAYRQTLQLSLQLITVYQLRYAQF